MLPAEASATECRNSHHLSDTILFPSNMTHIFSVFISSIFCRLPVILRIFFHLFILIIIIVQVFSSLCLSHTLSLLFFSIGYFRFSFELKTKTNFRHFAKKVLNHISIKCFLSSKALVLWANCVEKLKSFLLLSCGFEKNS